MSTAKHSQLPWKSLEDDPKDFSGMDAWGKTFALITDQEDEVKQEYVGFTLKGEDAALIVKYVNLLPELVEALEDAASGLSVLADDSGLESRAENVRSQVEQIRELLKKARQ